ncbi:hypothetical protein C8J57DRAFT_92533 [Mycena rebaudengoi]|nr:hypothetical protein C8J57DRAFT_92533 [Mycena rebaudengoi]
MEVEILEWRYGVARCHFYAGNFFPRYISPCSRLLVSSAVIPRRPTHLLLLARIILLAHILVDFRCKIDLEHTATLPIPLFLLIWPAVTSRRCREIYIEVYPPSLNTFLLDSDYGRLAEGSTATSILSGTRVESLMSAADADGDGEFGWVGPEGISPFWRAPPVSSVSEIAPSGTAAASSSSGAASTSIPVASDRPPMPFPSAEAMQDSEPTHEADYFHFLAEAVSPPAPRVVRRIHRRITPSLPAHIVERGAPRMRQRLPPLAQAPQCRTTWGARM